LVGCSLADVVDDSDEFVGAVSLLARELDELACAHGDRALGWASGDGDAAAAAEVEKSFVAEHAEGAEDGVSVHAEHGGQILRGREPLARLCLAVCDCAADFRGDLFVEVGLGATVELAVQHDATYTSFIVATETTTALKLPLGLASARAGVVPLIKEARRRQRKRRLVLAVVVLAGATAGLALYATIGRGGGSAPAPRAGAPHARVPLYFPAMFGALVPTAPAHPLRTPTAAVAALVSGPRPAARAAGARSPFPAGTRSRGVNVSGRIATVALSGSRLANLATIPRVRLIASITFTLSSFPAIAAVRFTFHHRPWGIYDRAGHVIRTYGRPALPVLADCMRTVGRPIPRHRAGAPPTSPNTAAAHPLPLVLQCQPGLF
jgi:hypothetical protein